MRLLSKILLATAECLWAFCVGFAVVFTGKMVYYGLRDALKDRK